MATSVHVAWLDASPSLYVACKHGLGMHANTCNMWREREVSTHARLHGYLTTCTGVLVIVCFMFVLFWCGVLGLGFLPLQLI